MRLHWEAKFKQYWESNPVLLVCHYYVLATVTLFPEAKMSEGMAGGKRKESKSIVCGGGNFLGYRETFHMWLSNPMNCKERGLKAHTLTAATLVYI